MQNNCHTANMYIHLTFIEVKYKHKKLQNCITDHLCKKTSSDKYFNQYKCPSRVSIGPIADV